MDPSLKKAYLTFLDDSSPRGKVIDLFNQYIEKNPESEFLPEIYLRIGALCCIHPKEQFDESYESKLADTYYEKARISRDKIGYFSHIVPRR